MANNGNLRQDGSLTMRERGRSESDPTSHEQLWGALDYLASQLRALRIAVELGDLASAQTLVRKWRKEYEETEREMLRQHERIRHLFDRAHLGIRSLDLDSSTEGQSS